jgi:AcrR family transcriptional regulator
MTQKTDNLRVKRTSILLREALIALIEERGFTSLTVGELTERAMASRAAFYRTPIHDDHTMLLLTGVQ